ncbi:MAG: hypothetical protein WCN92_09305 [Eubacteriales bacterium]
MINNSKETVLDAPVDLSKSQKFSAVILGAFLMGALWRFRGENGWGSSWGLLTVGVIYLMFIFAIYGFRHKVNFLLFSVTALSFMLTTPGWGTLNSQITGVLTSGVDNGAGMIQVFINPFSGVFIMLCLGFGLASVFAFMVGRFFSERHYSFKDLFVVLLVFFAVEYAARLTISHLILNLIQPQAGELFAQGLQIAGIHDTPWHFYFTHIFDKNVAKTIHGGRNYTTSADMIGNAIAAFVVWLIMRFGLKDKTGGRIMLGICAAFAFAITFADLSLFFENGGYRMEHSYDLLFKLSGWGMWEYFTGFFAGGLIMLIFVRQPFDKLIASKDVEDTIFPKSNTKVYGILNFAATFVVALSVTLIRPFAGRYEGSSAYIPIYIALSVFFLGLSVIVILKKGVNLESVNFKKFCVYAMPVYLGASAFIYLFAGKDGNQNFRSIGAVANILVMTSCAVVAVLYLIIFKKGDIRRIKK